MISTLDSDRQRAALVAQLKKLRDAKREAEVAASQAPPPSARHPPAMAPARPPPRAGRRSSRRRHHQRWRRSRKRGLLGAIASVLTNVEADIKRGKTPFAYWGGRFNAAGNELFTIVSEPQPRAFGRTAAQFFPDIHRWGRARPAAVPAAAASTWRFGIEATRNRTRPRANCSSSPCAASRPSSSRSSPRSRSCASCRSARTHARDGHRVRDRRGRGVLVDLSDHVFAVRLGAPARRGHMLIDHARRAAVPDRHAAARSATPPRITTSPSSSARTSRR